MATTHLNKKSAYKAIRFPHELIDKIENKAQKEGVTFSSWVKSACEFYLRLNSDDLVKETKSVIETQENHIDFVLNAIHSEVARRKRKQKKLAKQKAGSN